MMGSTQARKLIPRNRFMDSARVSERNCAASIAQTIPLSEDTSEARQMRVAIVEDSPLIQERLCRALAAVRGVEVVGFATNVEAAKQLIETSRPDLLVLDVELEHGETSMGILRYVALAHPSIEAIMLSNFTWDSMRAGFLAEGAKAYFDKSLEFTKARDWIAQRQAGLDPDV